MARVSEIPEDHRSEEDLRPEGQPDSDRKRVDIPFEIRRAYYTYDIPGGETRGGHAHIRLEQFIIAVSGSFEVALDDGRLQTSFFLNRSYYGLYLPPMIWRDLMTSPPGPFVSCSRRSTTTNLTTSENTMPSSEW